VDAANAPPAGSRLVIDSLSVRRAGAATTALANTALTVEPGSVHGVYGASGCGKSTLLATVAGLLPWAHHAHVHGRITLDGNPLGELDPGQRAHLLATCLDRPESQLFLATPRHEIAAARRLHAPARLSDTAVDALGVRPLLDRRITELSSGERQRVALAVALAAAPRPILLDEPTAHLDADGHRALQRLIRTAAGLGSAIVIAEQAGWRLGATVDRWSELVDGTLRQSEPPQPPEVTPHGRGGEGHEVLHASNLKVIRGTRTILRDVSLSLRSGEIVTLSGANGSGKTSLAHVLAGFARPAAGAVSIGGRPAHRARRVGLVLSVAELQLFAPTVAGELATTGIDPGSAARILRRHRLEALGGRAPWTLSRGERQRLVHAVIDATQPDLVIVDEPAQGLAPGDVADLTDLLSRRSERGRAYLLLTHRQELAAFGHRRLEVRDGSVVELETR
jgi:energy-coupling factor transport system ATP-binding protein